MDRFTQADLAHFEALLRSDFPRNEEFYEMIMGFITATVRRKR